MQIVIGPDWKSTAAGWLSFALVTFGSISAFLASLAAASPKPNYTITILVAAVAFLTGLARAWVGWLQSYVQIAPISMPPVATVVTLPTIPASKIVVALLLAVGVLGLSGCPAGSNQQKASNAAKNVAHYEQTALATEIAIYNAGQSCLQTSTTDTAKAACIVITPDEHLFIQQQFKALDVVGVTMDSCIRTSTSTAGIVTCASTATSAVNQLNNDGALHLKSDKAKATFAAVIVAVNLAIATISTVLGGK